MDRAFGAADGNEEDNVIVLIPQRKLGVVDFPFFQGCLPHVEFGGPNDNHSIRTDGLLEGQSLVKLKPGIGDSRPGCTLATKVTTSLCGEAHRRGQKLTQVEVV